MKHCTRCEWERDSAFRYTKWNLLEWRRITTKVEHLFVDGGNVAACGRVVDR